MEARKHHHVEPEFLQDAKKRLQAAFGARLRGVILFGSEARGEAWTDSDIDLLLLLDMPVRLLADIGTAVDALYRLQISRDPIRCFSIIPVSLEAFDRKERLIYRTAAQEGIPL